MEESFAALESVVVLLTVPVLLIEEPVERERVVSGKSVDVGGWRVIPQRKNVDVLGIIE